MDSIPRMNIEHLEENDKMIPSGNGTDPDPPRDGLEKLNQISGDIQHSAPNQNILNKINQSSSVKRPGIQKPVVERAPRSLFLFTTNNKFRKW